MPSSRIHYFDWLRVAAVLGVVAYHALLPYTGEWLVNNRERSELLAAVVLLFETFGLGLLFLIAGASVRFALRTRTPRAFVRERAARLLVPFVVGTLLLSPMIWYIADVPGGTTAASYLEYLPTWPAIAASWDPIARTDQDFDVMTAETASVPWSGPGVDRR